MMFWKMSTSTKSGRTCGEDVLGICLLLASRSMVHLGRQALTGSDRLWQALTGSDRLRWHIRCGRRDVTSKHDTFDTWHVAHTRHDIRMTTSEALVGIRPAGEMLKTRVWRCKALHVLCMSSVCAVSVSLRAKNRKHMCQRKTQGAVSGNQQETPWNSTKQWFETNCNNLLTTGSINSWFNYYFFVAPDSPNHSQLPDWLASTHLQFTNLMNLSSTHTLNFF